MTAREYLSCCVRCQTLMGRDRSLSDEIIAGWPMQNFLNFIPNCQARGPQALEYPQPQARKNVTPSSNFLVQKDDTNAKYGDWPDWGSNPGPLPLMIRGNCKGSVITNYTIRPLVICDSAFRFWYYNPCLGWWGLVEEEIFLSPAVRFRLLTLGEVCIHEPWRLVVKLGARYDKYDVVL